MIFRSYLPTWSDPELYGHPKPLRALEALVRRMQREYVPRFFFQLKEDS